MCLSGCLTAYRKTALLEVEEQLKDRRWMGIEIKYGEDRYLTHCLVLAGWRTMLNLKARCWTRSPSTLQTLFAQQLRWRRSNIIDWIFTFTTLRQHMKMVNPVVLLYYFSLMLAIMIYPVVTFHGFMAGFSLQVIFIHCMMLIVLSVLYQIVTKYIRKEPGIQNVSTYIGLGFILPLSYLFITPLALFTLDSGSWETRKGQASQQKVSYENEL
jgi:cellulose synthase/poly-beta-1,6-N-acetylglucosamine synthase-like glycosyltransferase